MESGSFQNSDNRPTQPKWLKRPFTLSGDCGMDDPLILGSNTYRKELDLSLGVTALIEHLDAIGMAVEYPDDDEKQEEIYVKSFFFVAENAPSINPDCNGKNVLRFNYRWHELHTISPDNLCMDELVQIADGLYLGQLLYSVKPEIPYSPEKKIFSLPVRALRLFHAHGR